MTEPIDLTYQQLLDLASEYRQSAEIDEVMRLANDPDFSRALNLAYALGQQVEYVQDDDEDGPDEDDLRSEGYRNAVQDVREKFIDVEVSDLRQALSGWAREHGEEPDPEEPEPATEGEADDGGKP